MHFGVYIIIAVIAFLFVLACRHAVRLVLGKDSCCGGGGSCTGGDSCPCCAARKKREESRREKP